MGDTGMLEAIRWQMGPPASLKLLDQRLLPTKSIYIDIDGPEAAFSAIKVCCRWHQMLYASLNGS